MPTAQKKQETTAPKAPRLSKIERLKRDLAEAEAAEKAKLDTKIGVAKETLRIAVNALARANEKMNKAVDGLLELGVPAEDIDKFLVDMAPAAAEQAGQPETTEG